MRCGRRKKREPEVSCNVSFRVTTNLTTHQVAAVFPNVRRSGLVTLAMGQRRSGGVTRPSGCTCDSPSNKYAVPVIPFHTPQLTRTQVASTKSYTLLRSCLPRVREHGKSLEPGWPGEPCPRGVPNFGRPFAALQPPLW